MTWKTVFLMIKNRDYFLATLHTLDLLAPDPFKGWLSLETMKFWLFVLTKTLFLMTLMIKLTLGNIFIKVKNPPGGATVTK